MINFLLATIGYSLFGALVIYLVIRPQNSQLKEAYQERDELRLLRKMASRDYQAKKEDGQ